MVEDNRGSNRAMPASSLTWNNTPLLFDEPVARVAVVVDAVLLLQVLDVGELLPRVRAGHAVAEGLTRVQQDLLQAAREAHALVGGQVLQEGGETLLQAHRDVHPLDLDRRT